MKTEIDVKEYAKRLMSLDDILIIIHNHPDGDAAGTGIALCSVLRKLGKRAFLACADELPHNLEFVENYANERYCFFGNVSEIPDIRFNIISVDLASSGLVAGPLFDYSKNITLALDHHEVNTLECDAIYIEPFSSSAAETLYFAICELEKLSSKQLFDKNVACVLYCAISSDSGNFKYSNTSARTMHTAGELISLGAESADISRRLFDIKTLEIYKAESLCTRNVSFYGGGKIAFSYMTKDQATEISVGDNDFETCVNLLRTLEGVEIAIFAKEKRPLEDGTKNFRLSIRSNEYADVAELCSKFDGGGHQRAAGCSVAGDIEKVIETIIPEAEKIL